MPQDNLPVAAGGNPGVPAGTPGGGGVETTGALATVPATPTQPANDVEDWRARYDADIARLQADINAQKSSLQSENARIRREADERTRTLQEEIHKLRLASLDEPERKDYELSMTRQELQKLREEITHERERADQAGSIGELVATFGSMGIPASMLDLKSGPEALAESGWRAVMAKMQYLEKAVKNGLAGSGAPPATPSAQPPAGVAPAMPPGNVTPPPVTPPAGGATATGRTWGAVLKSLNDQTGRPWTEEEVWSAVELGKLPATIIPGLENAPLKVTK